MSLDARLPDLRHDFAVAAFPDGGLLLHLPSGDFFQLDATGAAIWSALLGDGSASQVVALLAVNLGRPVPEVEPLVHRWLDVAPSHDVGPPTGMAQFEENAVTMYLRHGSEVILSYDKLTHLVSPPAANHDVPDDVLAEALRVFLPKIFSRFCRVALHAAAVVLNGYVVLLSGESGDGKTTTARSIAQRVADSRVVSEDVVLLAEDGGSLAVMDGAEGLIQAWLAEATQTLVGNRTATSIVPLRRALIDAKGRLPLRKIVFLDRRKRYGKAWSLRPMSRTDLLVSLFRQSFLSSAQPATLRSHLQVCRTLAERLPGYESLAIPDGIEALASSFDQIETIAS